MINVSIIIPIYNTAPLLAECIQSALEQTHKPIEIILINDGSPDSAHEICESFLSKDNRIKYIQQENMGLGAARNVGFKAAKGKYIYFLDSDDYMSKNLIDNCITAAHHHDAEIVTFNTQVFSKKGFINSDHYKRELPTDKKISGKYILKENTKRKEYRPTVWLYFYSRNFLLDNNINFEEDILYEDNDYTYNALLNSSKVVYLSQKLLFHRVHNESIMGSTLNKKHLYSSIIVLRNINNLFINAGSPADQLKLLKFYAWLPARILLENRIFNLKLIKLYISTLIRNPKLISLLIFKEIFKFFLNLGGHKKS
jgi:glycosyltransferase involved in cell wall biosynthesis